MSLTMLSAPELWRGLCHPLTDQISQSRILKADRNKMAPHIFSLMVAFHVKVSLSRALSRSPYPLSENMSISTCLSGGLYVDVFK